MVFLDHFWAILLETAQKWPKNNITIFPDIGLTKKLSFHPQFKFSNQFMWCSPVKNYYSPILVRTKMSQIPFVEKFWNSWTPAKIVVKTMHTAQREYFVQMCITIVLEQCKRVFEVFLETRDGRLSQSCNLIRQEVHLSSP